jgi:hypothetical protein
MCWEVSRPQVVPSLNPRAQGYAFPAEEPAFAADSGDVCSFTSAEGAFLARARTLGYNGSLDRGGDIITHAVRVELPTHRDSPDLTFIASISVPLTLRHEPRRLPGLEL